MFVLITVVSSNEKCGRLTANLELTHLGQGLSHHQSHILTYLTELCTCRMVRLSQCSEVEVRSNFLLFHVSKYLESCLFVTNVND